MHVIFHSVSSLNTSYIPFLIISIISCIEYPDTKKKKGNTLNNSQPKLSKITKCNGYNIHFLTSSLKVLRPKIKLVGACYDYKLGNT